MKSIAKMVSVSLLVLTMTSGVAGARAVRAQPAPAAPAAPANNNTAYDRAPWWMKENVITQTGHVYTEIPANRASFSGTFLSVDESADKAQAKAIAQTKPLNEALARLGKDAVRVETSFSMRALYEQYRDKNGNKVEDQRGDKINGYEVSLQISVDVRDMDVLEKAYALVLAAAPTETASIYFQLQPSNETNTWLYNQAVKDARTRAEDAAVSAGGHLGGIKVIDPTGRACRGDILARNMDENYSNQANRVDYDESVQSSVSAKKRSSVATDAVAPQYLEAKALANTFLQTPPLQKLEATACVVYGVN